MGGKVPRKIKEEVIQDWILGLPREMIAKKNEIAVGTVTNIIKEAGKQQEYHDIELLRNVALVLNDNGLEPFIVGFAIRIKKIMEQNDINEDQIEPIISDVATYCYKQNFPFDNFIRSARESLDLAYRIGFPVERIPEYINQGMKTIHNLEEQRQAILLDIQGKKEKVERLFGEIKKYGEEQQLIERNRQLERQNKCLKMRVGSLVERVRIELQAALAIDKRNGELLYALSRCHEELEGLKN